MQIPDPTPEILIPWAWDQAEEYAFHKPYR